MFSGSFLELAVQQFVAVGTVDGLEPLLELGRGLVDFGVVALDCLLFPFGDAGQVMVLGLQPAHRVVPGSKDRQQAVVVPLRDGIVLVAVAAGTAHGQPHQTGGDLLHQMEEHVVPLSHQVHHVLVGAVEDGSEIAGGDELVQHFRGVGLGRAPVHEFVTGQLLHQELIVGHVLVESPDHPVPVAPHPVDDDHVVDGGVEPGDVAVAGRIQPMAAPTLTVVLRLQQRVDEPLVCIGPLVVEVGPDLLRRRRDSDQVQPGAAQQRELGGLGRETEPFGFEPCQQEGVNRRADPLSILHLRDGCGLRLPEGPELAVLVGHRRRFGLVEGGALCVRPQEPEVRSVDPAGERPDLAVAERPAHARGRHLARGQLSDQDALDGPEI